MFEAAELDHQVAKADYKREEAESAGRCWKCSAPWANSAASPCWS